MVQYGESSPRIIINEYSDDSFRLELGSGLCIRPLTMANYTKYYLLNTDVFFKPKKGCVSIHKRLVFLGKGVNMHAT